MDEAVTFQEELRVPFTSAEVEWPEREEGRMEVSVVKLMFTDHLPGLWLDPSWDHALSFQTQPIHLCLSLSLLIDGGGG